MPVIGCHLPGPNPWQTSDWGLGLKGTAIDDRVDADRARLTGRMTAAAERPAHRAQAAHLTAEPTAGVDPTGAGIMGTLHLVSFRRPPGLTRGRPTPKPRDQGCQTVVAATSGNGAGSIEVRGVMVTKSLPHNAVSLAGSLPADDAPTTNWSLRSDTSALATRK